MTFKVISFDLDGTLLVDTSVSAWFARETGHEAAGRELEAQFRDRLISNATVADTTAAWLKGMSRQDVWRSLENAPWIDGIEVTLGTLRAWGLKTLLSTISWKIAAEFLQARYSFDGICGTEIELNGDCLSGHVSRYFDENDKSRFVEEFCRRKGLFLRECVAVGDSRSDVALFQKVGFAIALNATEDARKAATVSVDAQDLRVVLGLLVKYGGPAL